MVYNDDLEIPLLLETPIYTGLGTISGPSLQVTMASEGG